MVLTGLVALILLVFGGICGPGVVPICYSKVSDDAVGAAPLRGGPELGYPRAQEVDMSITPVSPVVPVTAALAIDSEAGSSHSSARVHVTDEAAVGEGGVSVAVPEAASTGYGSLLLPSTGTNLLKLIAEEAVSDNHASALTPRQWLARYMALSIVSPRRLPRIGEANYHDQADLDLIKAATGYNFVVLDRATAVVDDEGHPAPDAIGRQVLALVTKVSGDRTAGVISGELTPDYLRAMFSEYGDAEQPFPEGWLDAALDFWEGRLTRSANHANLIA
jgi:hypothetical protein